MAVEPRLRGFGYGKRLLGEIDGACRQLGLQKLFLHARPVAKAFYMEAGFRSPTSDEARLYDAHVASDTLESEVLVQFYYEVITLVKEVSMRP